MIACATIVNIGYLPTVRTHQRTDILVLRIRVHGLTLYLSFVTNLKGHQSEKMHASVACRAHACHRFIFLSSKHILVLTFTKRPHDEFEFVNKRRQ